MRQWTCVIPEASVGSGLWPVPIRRVRLAANPPVLCVRQNVRTGIAGRAQCRETHAKRVSVSRIPGYYRVKKPDSGFTRFEQAAAFRRRHRTPLPRLGRARQAGIRRSRLRRRATAPRRRVQRQRRRYRRKISGARLRALRHSPTPGRLAHTAAPGSRTTIPGRRPRTGRAQHRLRDPAPPHSVQPATSRRRARARHDLTRPDRNNVFMVRPAFLDRARRSRRCGTSDGSQSAAVTLSFTACKSQALTNFSYSPVLAKSRCSANIRQRNVYGQARRGRMSSLIAE